MGGSRGREAGIPTAVISLRGVQYAIIPRKPAWFTGQYSLGHIDTPILPVSGLEEFLHVRRDQCDARRSSRGKGGSVLTYGKFKDVEAGNAGLGPRPRYHINALAANCRSIGASEPGCPESRHFWRTSDWRPVKALAFLTWKGSARLTYGKFTAKIKDVAKARRGVR